LVSLDLSARTRRSEHDSKYRTADTGQGILHSVQQKQDTQDGTAGAGQLRQVSQERSAGQDGQNIAVRKGQLRQDSRER
jgi:hypothetical protein